MPTGKGQVYRRFCFCSIFFYSADSKSLTGFQSAGWPPVISFFFCCFADDHLVLYVFLPKRGKCCALTLLAVDSNRRPTAKDYPRDSALPTPADMELRAFYHISDLSISSDVMSSYLQIETRGYNIYMDVR